MRSAIKTARDKVAKVGHTNMSPILQIFYFI